MEYGVIHEIGDYSDLRNTKDSQSIKEQVESNKKKNNNTEDDDESR